MLLVPEPACREVDGLRRALRRVAGVVVSPHVTLANPVNVREADVPVALDVVRAAAERAHPLDLRLGPVATFHPDSPVVHLAVGGDVDGLRALRDRVLAGPLARPAPWPFVPHVTLAEDLAPERIGAALAVLDGYRADVEIAGVHVLAEERDDDGLRCWRPVADAAFGPARVVGRGGLELVLTRSEQPDLEAVGLLTAPSGAVPVGAPTGAVPVTLTARREGRPVGVAAGWWSGGSADLGALVVAAPERATGVGSHLLAHLQALLVEAGCRVVRTEQPEGALATLLRRRGWVPDSGVRAAPGWVALCRPLGSRS